MIDADHITLDQIKLSFFRSFNLFHGLLKKLVEKLVQDNLANIMEQADNKEILDNNEQILVYYGAADTAICVATTRVAYLIPIENLANMV